MRGTVTRPARTGPSDRPTGFAGAAAALAGVQVRGVAAPQLGRTAARSQDKHSAGRHQGSGKAARMCPARAGSEGQADPRLCPGVFCAHG